jgi:membrane-bound lytic murein transglycosylase MltF
MNLKLWSYGILLPVVLVLSASLCGAEEMEGGLSRIRESGIDCTVMLHEDVPEEELIRQVAEGTIEITIADSNIAQLNRRYYPNIKIGIPIAEPQGLGWAVRKGDKALIKAINGFFNMDLLETAA